MPRSRQRLSSTSGTNGIERNGNDRLDVDRVELAGGFRTYPLVVAELHRQPDKGREWIEQLLGEFVLALGMHKRYRDD